MYCLHRPTTDRPQKQPIAWPTTLEICAAPIADRSHDCAHIHCLHGQISQLIYGPSGLLCKQCNNLVQPQRETTTLLWQCLHRQSRSQEGKGGRDLTSLVGLGCVWLEYPNNHFPKFRHPQGHQKLENNVIVYICCPPAGPLTIFKNNVSFQTKFPPQTTESYDLKNVARRALKGVKQRVCSRFSPPAAPIKFVFLPPAGPLTF